ncbi:mannosyltransferase [Streptomyces sp. DvalAA-14]|nr:mannosyltransferase [Streptomyces sp. DvalAA-14]
MALAFGLWRLTTPGMWRDEAASYSIAQRSLAQLWKMTAQVDAVHGVYYLLIHLDFAVFGPSVLALRLPSVLAGAATAALLAAVGARLANSRVGLFAGLFWAVLPQVSRYLQEGRSTSLVSLCVVAAAYFLIRQKWVAFGVAAALAGALNLLSVLCLVAFAVALVVWRTQRAVDNRVLRRAGAVMVVAVLVGALPVALRSHGEASVLSWIPRPNSHTLMGLARAMTGTRRLIVPVGLLSLLGCVYAFLRREERQLAALALPLTVLPPALLITYSLIGPPTFVLRYVLYSLIGAAWLFALGLDALLSLAARLLGLLAGRLGGAVNGPPGLVAGALAIAIVSTLSWHNQTQIRTVDGHGDPLLRMSRVIRDNSRPGDGVLFFLADRRYAELAYPADFRNTRDLMLATTPAQAGDLYGEEYPLPQLAARLKGYKRVWVLWGRLKWVAERTDGFSQIRSDGFRLNATWVIEPSEQVLLYTQDPKAAKAGKHPKGSKNGKGAKDGKHAGSTGRAKSAEKH